MEKPALGMGMILEEIEVEDLLAELPKTSNTRLMI